MSQKDVEFILSNPRVIDDIVSYNYNDLYQLIKTASPIVKGELTTVLYKSNLLDLQYLTAIPDFMLYGSAGINYLKLPSNIKIIGFAAFCYSEIQKIDLNSGLESIDTRSFSNSALEGDLIIPDTVKKIGHAAFRNTHITSIILPSKLQTIGQMVFDGCDNLDKLTFTNPDPFKRVVAPGLYLPHKSCEIHLPKSWIGSDFYTELKSAGYYNIHFD